MVEIPKGEIVLRDDRINEKWKVIIQPFLLSKYLVTQELYELITQQNPSASKGKNKPVECVSWLDSVKFCNLLSGKLGLTPYYKVDDELDDFIIDTTANGYRLPSEAE
ncbi:MAG: SUMF1/EgtB/PvdO family nonheme iron enzyme [Bacteroidetes bacterium]|nr:SUMF1/EgtB/PvdO family nonheme iron enzyme [Bacteroidota bacterium]